MKTKTLSERAQEDLAASGLDSRTIWLMQCTPVDGSNNYLFPYFGLGGELIDFRREKRFNGRVKYLQASGSPVKLYFPPVMDRKWTEIATDTATTIMITEGEKKAAVASAKIMPTVGLGGVDNIITDDWNLLTLKGRTVYIVFDHDVKAKTVKNVAFARSKLASKLHKRGATVLLVDLPGNERIGLDDYIVQHGVEAFRALLAKATPYEPRTEREGEFVIDPTKIHLAIARAHEVLNATGMVYQRETLVRPVVVGSTPIDDRIDRDPNSIVVYPLSKEWLATILTEHGAWAEPRGKGDPLPCGFSVSEAGRVLQVRDAWTEPVLRGIAECPIVRADGSVCTTEGYDPASGMWLREDFPNVPSNPTPQDAMIALSWLKLVLHQFPFASPADESVALAAMLTTVARHRMDCAPAFAFDAPSMASGKSLLADIIAMIAAGHRAPATNYPTNEEELDKRIMSSLRVGDSILCFDNVNRVIEGATLASVLTQPVYSGRILGVSVMVKLPTNVMLLLTGNNLVFRGDLPTRVLVCRIEPDCERPGERKFAGHPLLEWVESMRDVLLSAILIIWRAWYAAQCPKFEIPQMREYRQFSDVRQMLVWLKEADPYATQSAIVDEDPDRVSVAELVRELRSTFDGRPWSAKDVIEKTKMTQTGRNNEALYNALASTCMDSKGNSDVSALRFGYVLKRWQGVVFGSLKLTGKLDKHEGIKYWKVEQTVTKAESGALINARRF